MPVYLRGLRNSTSACFNNPLQHPPPCRMLLDSCHVVLGIFLSLIYALEGNMVTLQASSCCPLDALWTVLL